MADLPKAPIKRIIKEVDDLMISEDGLNLFIEETAEFIKKLTEKSFESAKSNKRKTIKPEDVAAGKKALFSE
jgi:histone H3/H4